MQELRVAAKVHSTNSPVFGKAIQVIRLRIDREFHNQVNYQSFVALVQERSRRCTSEALFRQLDRGGKGYLDQDDLLVLYYLMDTRGDCSDCGDVLRSVYYTCLPCFDDCRSPNSPSFDVCGPCYRAKSFNHPQHGVFVDNYELLQKRRSQGFNWGQLSETALHDLMAGLAVKAIQAAYRGGEATGQNLGGATEMVDEDPPQAPEAMGSEGPGLDFDSQSVTATTSGAENDWAETLGDWAETLGDWAEAIADSLL